MESYQAVFGRTLTLSTYGEYGAPDTPEADGIMHGQLERTAGIDELRSYWARLSDGGTVSVPLETQMRGDEFGQCVDQFGIGWLVNIGQPRT
jgi:PhnB protein